MNAEPNTYAFAGGPLAGQTRRMDPSELPLVLEGGRYEPTDWGSGDGATLDPPKSYTLRWLPENE